MRLRDFHGARAETTRAFDLDPAAHGTFDVVYSWGVLHHTGGMYCTIVKAAAMVAPGGLFAFALCPAHQRRDGSFLEVGKTVVQRCLAKHAVVVARRVRLADAVGLSAEWSIVRR